MDISKETNIEKLQSMAYTQYKAAAVAQQNLQILEARINELQSEAEETEQEQK